MAVVEIAVDRVGAREGVVYADESGSRCDDAGVTVSRGR